MTPERGSIADAELSRTISHALRHEPAVYGLELDAGGWVSVDLLVEALHREGGDWADVRVADIERIVSSASKRRHEIAGGRIRALYGHSVPGDVHLEQADPPDLLYHGTNAKSWDAIRSLGLLPMSRQYVHLSVDMDTATTVGRRKGGRTVILEVRAREAAESGLAFFRGNECTWLAPNVPPEFVLPTD